MSVIYLDVYCPLCNGEEISSSYKEERSTIVCECLRCEKSDILDNFDYVINN